MAAGFQALDQNGDKRCLNQPSFVMALFVPGIRKKNQDVINRAQRNLLLEHRDRVVAYDAQIR